MVPSAFPRQTAEEHLKAGVVCSTCWPARAETQVRDPLGAVGGRRCLGLCD